MLREPWKVAQPDLAGVKPTPARAEGAHVSDQTASKTNDPGGAGAAGVDVRLEVVGGTVRIDAPPDATGDAELSWPRDVVKVWVDGREEEGTSCRVPASAHLRVEAVSIPPNVRYMVGVSRDRMEATLRVGLEPGWQRTLRDAAPVARLRLAVDEQVLDPDAPEESAASAELQDAGIVHGLDPERVAEALAEPGREVVVATGTDPIEGRNGYLEHLIDFEELRRVGVLADTPLVRRVRRREGVAGRDVLGNELGVPEARDAKLKAGPGVALDEHGIMAVATCDGAPHIDADGTVEVRHELVLEIIDTVSGDVSFNGSIRVRGDVGEGRRVVARDELSVEGNVDRAYLESGGSMTIAGSVMSSVLRAGGERAVAATIADRILDLPRELGIVAAQARQFRDQAVSRGTEVSHGLSVQLVLERIHRTVLPTIASIQEDLREAGPSHADTADMVAAWHRMLSTAANNSLTPEQYRDVLQEVSTLADDVQRATEHAADLVVSYLQACEAEATGTVTLVGKGIFNSRIVAWGGMVAEHYEAVFRGGSIVSHGRVHVREVGSPAGAKTLVQLGASARLEADRAFAGTVVAGPGYTHRFNADRTCIRIDFDGSGQMNVESLAA
jgi:hypothetical protein